MSFANEPLESEFVRIEELNSNRSPLTDEDVLDISLRQKIEQVIVKVNKPLTKDELNRLPDFLGLDECINVDCVRVTPRWIHK